MTHRPTNEALRQAQTALEESRDRYVNLYDCAPIGCLTLSLDGLIAEARRQSEWLAGCRRNTALRRTQGASG